jgi:hypothetical protein
VDGLLERLARAVALAALVALAATACAAVDPPCATQTITVAQKDDRSRVEMRRGTRTTATGTIEETQTPVPVAEYYVRAADDGKWYRVGEREFRAVALQQRMEVCR